MKIIVVKPNRKPIVEEIEHTLENMQAVVGGHIEAVYPYDDEVAIICNEEGKLCRLPLNRFLVDENGKFYDYIAGTFFICGAPKDGDNFESIPDALIDKYMAIFR